jgi:hypothetical protein
MNFIKFSGKSILVHTITYFIFGLILSNFFDYQSLFEKEIIRDFMRGYDSPLIMLGPFLQPVRGFIFALGIWPIRSIIFEKKTGWAILWNIIIVFGIISTPSAAPASIEGMIYSKLPLWYHFIGYPEILLQTLVYSLWLFFWIRKKNL